MFGQELFEFAFTDTYAHLDELLDFTKENATNENVKLIWNLPWTCQGDIEDERFNKFGRNQEEMYGALLDVCKNFILPNKKLCGIIPTGTVIQNMRTSFLGDSMTRDGIHLIYGIGQYAASLAFAAYLTGIPSKLIDYIPDEYSKAIEIHRAIMCDGCYYALRQPYLFRASKYVEIAELGLDTDYTKG